uniref:Uncharacterized protein n=1 Tax=Anopheles merus TaxID=30066 RepID=A0A182VMQ2_ANOME
MALHFCFGSKTPQFRCTIDYAVSVGMGGEAWTVYIIYCPLHQAAAIRMDAKWKTYIRTTSGRGNCWFHYCCFYCFSTGPPGCTNVRMRVWFNHHIIIIISINIIIIIIIIIIITIMTVEHVSHGYEVTSSHFHRFNS